MRVTEGLWGVCFLAKDNPSPAFRGSSLYTREPKSCGRFVRQYGSPLAIGLRLFSDRRGRRSLHSEWENGTEIVLDAVYIMCEQGNHKNPLSPVGTGVLDGPKNNGVPFSIDGRSTCEVCHSEQVKHSGIAKETFEESFAVGEQHACVGRIGGFPP